MSRNPGVRVRGGNVDTRTDKPCRNCGVLMDDGGTHYVCLACGWRMEKPNKPASGEVSPWQKQVADLHSQKFLTAGQARGMQMMASHGPLRLGLFLALGALFALGPLQNVEHLWNGTTPAPLAYETAGVLGILLLLAAWVGFGQPGAARMLQRNIMAAVALAGLMGLAASKLISSMLATQYGALFDTASRQEGMAIGIASVPAWWQAPLLLGGIFVIFGALSVICHLEATDNRY